MAINKNIDAILADPEFQRLWQARAAFLSNANPTDAERQAFATGPGAQLSARYQALGGDMNLFPKIGPNGEPVITEGKSKLGFAGKTALYAGGALAGGLLAGAAGGAGAAGTAAQAAGGAGTAATTAGTTGGILGTLGKVGGALGKIGSVAGPVLAAAGEGRAAGRQADAQAALGRDRMETERYLATLAMLRQQNEQNEIASRNARLGGLLEGTQDVNISAPAGIPMGNITGGLKPSALIGKSELGKELRRKATLDLMRPDSGVPAPPPLTDLPKSSWLDTALGVGSTALSGAALYDDMRKPKQPRTSAGIINPGVVRGSGITFR